MLQLSMLTLWPGSSLTNSWKDLQTVTNHSGQQQPIYLTWPPTFFLVTSSIKDSFEDQHMQNMFCIEPRLCDGGQLRPKGLPLREGVYLGCSTGLLGFTQTF